MSLNLFGDPSPTQLSFLVFQHPSLVTFGWMLDMVNFLVLGTRFCFFSFKFFLCFVLGHSYLESHWPFWSSLWLSALKRHWNNHLLRSPFLQTNLSKTEITVKCSSTLLLRLPVVSHLSNNAKSLHRMHFPTILSVFSSTPSYTWFLSCSPCFLPLGLCWHWGAFFENSHPLPYHFKSFRVSYKKMSASLENLSCFFNHWSSYLFPLSWAQSFFLYHLTTLP